LSSAIDGRTHSQIEDPAVGLQCLVGVKRRSSVSAVRPTWAGRLASMRKARNRRETC